MIGTSVMKELNSVTRLERITPIKLSYSKLSYSNYYHGADMIPSYMFYIIRRCSG